jgi:hypothetical protein
MTRFAALVVVDVRRQAPRRGQRARVACLRTKRAGGRLGGFSPDGSNRLAHRRVESEPSHFFGLLPQARPWACS